MRNFKPGALRGAVVALALLPAFASAGVFTVEQVSGLASVTRRGAELPVRPGDTLHQGDRLHVNEEAWVRLALASHGVVEVGAEGELHLERAPDAEDSSDLATSLRLDRGALRVMSKRDAGWPLLVHLGMVEASLGAGEFFFKADGEGPLPLCVAAGKATASLAEGPAPQALTGPACYSLRQGLPAARDVRTAADFAEVRKSLDLDRLLQGDLVPPPPAVALLVPLPEPEPVLVPEPAVPLPPSMVAEEAPAPSPAPPEFLPVDPIPPLPVPAVPLPLLDLAPALAALPVAPPLIDAAEAAPVPPPPSPPPPPEPPPAPVVMPLPVPATAALPPPPRPAQESPWKNAGPVFPDAQSP